jgi:hypothetical protein
MKVLKFCFALCLGLGIFGCAGSVKIKLPENPKIAAYWTSPTMSLDEADSLAHFHLVIADMENIPNNRASLVRLKKRNPELKLLCYSNPMELFDIGTLNINRPWQKEVYNEVTQNRPGYWLKQPSGEPVVFWNGMKMLNLSTECPVIKGEKYNQFIAEFLLTRVLSDTIWDGYFEDNATGNIAWVGSWGNNKGLDADNDSVADDEQVLDSCWYEGVHEFISLIRQAKGPKFILIGNKGSKDFLDVFDGKMFEEFPNDYLGDKRANGWYQCQENYLRTGQYTIIQAKQIPNDPTHRIFVLASALMGDGYYAYAQDFYRHFPEYEKDIGKPLGPPEIKVGVWERKFFKATVRVFPENERGEIEYLTAPLTDAR